MKTRDAMHIGSKGFTLVELMVVIGIIAILAALVYPSYVREVVKTKRSTGAACLMEEAQFMERYYTTHMTYKAAALPGDMACATDLNGVYTFAVAAGADEDTTYTLTAVPQGRQAAKDSLCGTMTVDEKGAKSVSGSASSASECF
jgi:type IV pilus assembly protein PilE